MAYLTGAGSLVSLTFDDGLPCQIQYALPALRKWLLPATFFVIANDVTEFDTQFRTYVWQKAHHEGHEIGSHSRTHRKAASLSVAEAVMEAQDSKFWIQQRLGQPVTSFCYPFTDAPAHLKGAVIGAGYKQARGGRVARLDKYLQPGDGADLHNVTCIHVGPETIKDADEWINTAVRRGAWLTLMLHGVGDPQAWDNLAVDQFDTLLSKLRGAAPRGLQVATFAECADMYRQGRGL